MCSALMLARWYSEPLAVVDIPLGDGAADAGQVAQAIWESVEPGHGAVLGGGRPRPRRWPPALAPAAQPGPGGGFGAPATAVLGPQTLRESGLRLPWPPAYLLGRAATLRNAPPASVIICTRDRAERLDGCLTAVLRQDYPDFEVIVVDNAPSPTRWPTWWPAATRPGRAACRCGTSPSTAPGCPGRATRAARRLGRIVAYLDDDEHPDQHWLAELARGFTLGHGVAGVSGIVLPAVLETPAQRLYEQFGGHSKGRGLTAEVFDTASHASSTRCTRCPRSASARPWPSTARR